MKCVVITPVGPGHEQLAHQCRSTVERAKQEDVGAFDHIEHLLIDDTRATLGRSSARNLGVQKAIASGADWIFFLDADDGLLPQAFAAVTPYLSETDAIWGQIWEMPSGQPTFQPRIPQILTLNALEDLLLHDPFLTLQMGHFVRAQVALKTPFRAELNAGEDFEYYLRLWNRFRCLKVPQAFFVNRRGLHSSGPRSANGEQWRVAVEALLSAARQQAGIDPQSSRAKLRINAKTLEYRNALSAMGFSAEQLPALALSKAMPYFGIWEVSCYTCPPFRMLSQNDDRVLSRILWNKTFQPQTLSAWLSLCAHADLILDIGAYTGLYGLAAAAQNPNASVFCFEPLPQNAARIRQNLSLNAFPHLELQEVALASCDGPARLHFLPTPDFLPSHASLRPLEPTAPCAHQDVPALRLESFLRHISSCAFPKRLLLKIDVAGAAADILKGMGELLSHLEVDLLLDRSDGEHPASLTTLLKPLGYKAYRIQEHLSDLQLIPSLCRSESSSLPRPISSHLLTRKTPAQLRSVCHLSVTGD